MDLCLDNMPSIPYNSTLCFCLHTDFIAIIAILAASVSNFLANDRWTFKRHKR